MIFKSESSSECIFRSIGNLIPLETGWSFPPVREVIPLQTGKVLIYVIVFFVVKKFITKGTMTMHDYNTIVGVISLRNDKVSYPVITIALYVSINDHTKAFRNTLQIP